MRAPRTIALVLTVSAFALAGCAEQYVDPTPERQDGSQSQEFEQDDIDAANNASPAVQDYCADAVSEAQRVGCEAHVTEDEIP